MPTIGRFMVGERQKKVSMKLMASLAPAQAEVEAEVMAKADQHSFCILIVLRLAMYRIIQEKYAKKKQFFLFLSYV